MDSSFQQKYARSQNDGGGHTRQYIHYVNGTHKLDSGNPPLWQNIVWIWNFQANRWDISYQRQYRVSQLDCSNPANNCGWWGPTIEDQLQGSDPSAAIKEVGYKNAYLYTDGTFHNLTTAETDFLYPPLLHPWLVYHRQTPNRSWTMGSKMVLQLDSCKWHNKVLMWDTNGDGTKDKVRCGHFVFCTSGPGTTDWAELHASTNGSTDDRVIDRYPVSGWESYPPPGTHYNEREISYGANEYLKVCVKVWNGSQWLTACTGWFQPWNDMWLNGP